MGQNRSGNGRGANAARPGTGQVGFQSGPLLGRKAPTNQYQYHYREPSFLRKVLTSPKVVAFTGFASTGLAIHFLGEPLGGALSGAAFGTSLAALLILPTTGVAFREEIEQARQVFRGDREEVRQAIRNRRP